MKVVAKVSFVLLLVGIVGVLKGCGCDEDAAKKCTATSCKDITKCFNDASCCDYEKDGAKVKDAMKVICDAAGASADNACA